MMSVVLIMLLLILSGCSSAQENSLQQETQRSSAPASSVEPAMPSETSGSPPEDYQDIFNGGSYLLHYKGTVTFMGQTIESDVTFATDGGNTSVVNVLNGMTAHILVKDGVTYQIDDGAKTYYPIAETDATENVLNISGKKRVGEGTGNMDSKELTYEEYQFEDEKTRFYFNDKKLHAVSTKTPDSESLMIVLELTDQVPASALSIPADTEITDTAILDGQVPDDLKKQADELIKQMEGASYLEGDYRNDIPPGE
jgi:PBP1b-binding outer membrane lipoprotein LpoB